MIANDVAVPVNPVVPVAPEPPTTHTLYVEAVHSLIETQWGVQNAWIAKRRPQS